MLLLLPPELVEKIICFCTRTDLKNLSYCNKNFYDITQSLRWQSIHITWHMISEICDHVLYQNLHLVKSLDIDNEIEKPEKTTHNISGQQVKETLFEMLDYIDSKKLTMLSIDCLIHKGSDASNSMKIKNMEFGNILQRLPNIEELVLTSPLGMKSGWVHLKSLDKLKKLTLYCRVVSITNKDINCICANLNPNFDELQIDRSFRITNECLESISQLTSLKKLSITRNRNVDFISSNLANLVYLNIENSSIENETLIYISQHMKTLLTLNINCCKRISQLGIRYIAKLETLEEFHASFTQLCNSAFQYLQNISLKHLTFGGDFVTPDIFAILINIPSIQSLDVYDDKNVFTKESLDEFCFVNNMVRKHVVLRIISNTSGMRLEKI